MAERLDLSKEAVDLNFKDPDNPMNALTELQEGFVLHFCKTAGRNATKSARAAGYSEMGASSAAYANLHNPKVLKALKYMAERKMQAASYRATEVMIEMMEGIAPNGAAVPPAEIRKIAEHVQGFNEIVAVRRSQVDINVNDSRTPSQILDGIFDLIKEIGGPEAKALQERVEKLVPQIEGPVIDGEFTEEEDFSNMVIE